MRSGLILADSLAFARPKHGVLLENTWPYLLQNYTNDFLIYQANGGAMSNTLVDEANQIRSYYHKENLDKTFDWCVVQVGIVDCSPRKISTRLNYLIQKFIPNGAQIIRRINRSNLFKKQMKPWISLDQFRNNINNIHLALQPMCSNIFFIEIAPPCHNLILNCGDFSQEVYKYNSVLKELMNDKHLTPFSSNDDLEKSFLPDGHHLTKRGHKLVANSIIESMEKK